MKNNSNQKIQATSRHDGIFNNAGVVRLRIALACAIGFLIPASASATDYLIDTSTSTPITLSAGDTSTLTSAGQINLTGTTQANTTGITLGNGAGNGTQVMINNGIIDGTSTATTGNTGIGIFIAQGATINGTITNNGTIFGSQGAITTTLPTGTAVTINGDIINNGSLYATTTVSPNTQTTRALQLINTILNGAISNYGLIQIGAPSLASLGSLPSSVLQSFTISSNLNALNSDRYFGINIQNSQVIGGIQNYGTIYAQGNAAIGVAGSMSSLPTVSNGIYNAAGATLSSSTAGIRIFANANVSGDLTNAGTITGFTGFATGSGTVSGGGIYVASSILNGNINNLNTGVINSPNSGILISASAVNGGIYNAGSIATTLSSVSSISLTGNSTISGPISNQVGGSITSAQDGISIQTTSSTGVSGGISNSGNINATRYGISIGASAIISGGITNTGNITGGSYDINTAARIGALNNLQGAGNSSGALTYKGVLPNNYNIIINSPLNYGQLAVTTPTLATTFGITTGSYVTQLIYTGVMSGVTSSNFNSLTGAFGLANWSLVQEGTPGIWDLVFNRLPATDITGAGTIYQSSNLGTSVNPVFDGGTLKVSSAGSIANNFTVNANNGVIDQNGMNSNFSGVISDAGIGTSGSIAIANTGNGGSVTFSGTNTYTGSTTINSGATLALMGTGSIAQSSGVVDNGTLNISGSTSGASIQSLSGNGVVVLGAKTLAITNGADTFAGVIGGAGGLNITGGTETLAGTNAYTSSTTVGIGSTLALVGAGSITPSSELNNNGTVDIRGANGNVVLGGTFTQASTGGLLMNVSPINNQKVLVTGAAALAGGLSLTASAGTYTVGKYTLLAANGLTGTFGSFTSNLSSYTRLAYTLSYDANDVYLILTPNVADTQQSLVNTATTLQNIYTLQNSVLANSLAYDCNEFGSSGVCISVGDRNTAVSVANGLNNTSGLLIAAYRPHQNYRVGAYIDQNLSVNNAGSTVSLGNNTPLIGFFSAWNEHLDGTGTEVKISAAYGQKSANINRQIVGGSEAGSGSSQLNSQGAQITAKYGFALLPAVIVSPYVGIRYTQNNMNGYTEGASATVSAPLTYSALNTNATTALAGLGASYRFIPKATVFGSVGVETDTNTANGTYSATGLSGLTPINFNANPVKTRPTAMLGAFYDLAKNQRLGVTGIYRQEPFQAVSTTTVMATYTIGL